MTPEPARACAYSRCERRIDHRKFYCASHWKRIPRGTRRQLLAEYQPGQRDGLVIPTKAFYEALMLANRALVAWDKEHVAG